MYGKIFDTLFTGSMVGAGAHVFAVWAYALANVNQDSHVELNPRFLAPVIGTDISSIQSAIDYLCAPDPESRSKSEDGRRLLKVGSFLYYMVNHQDYLEIRSKVERREQDRQRKADYRARRRTKTVENVPDKSRTCPQVSAESAHISVSVSVSESDPPLPPKGERPPKAAKSKVERIWAVYPRKVAKPRGILAIERAIGDVKASLGFETHDQAADWLYDQTLLFQASQAGHEEQYIPHAPTWFNQQRYNDAPSTWESWKKKQNGAPRRGQLSTGDYDL